MLALGENQSRGYQIVIRSFPSSALGGNANGLMIAIDQTPDTKLERRAHEGDPSEANVLLADVRQKFPRFRELSHNLSKHRQPPIHNR